MASASYCNIGGSIYGIVHKDKLSQSRHLPAQDFYTKYGEAGAHFYMQIPVFHTWRTCDRQSLTALAAYPPTPSSVYIFCKIQSAISHLQSKNPLQNKVTFQSLKVWKPLILLGLCKMCILHGTF